MAPVERADMESCWYDYINAIWSLYCMT